MCQVTSTFVATSDADDSTPRDHPVVQASATDVGQAKRSLARNVLIYTAARLVLVAVLVAVLLGVATLVGVAIPLIIALAVAVIIQLPLSHLLLAGLRSRLTADMEVVGARRREEKEHLRAQLRGEDTSP